MSTIRTRKAKRNPNYSFLVSWDQKQTKKAHVKRETKIGTHHAPASNKVGKNADSLAQAETGALIKKDIIRSLIVISLILILELVVYLAWTKFVAI